MSAMFLHHLGRTETPLDVVGHYGRGAESIGQLARANPGIATRRSGNRLIVDPQAWHAAGAVAVPSFWRNGAVGRGGQAYDPPPHAGAEDAPTRGEVVLPQGIPNIDLTSGGEESGDGGQEPASEDSSSNAIIAVVGLAAVIGLGIWLATKR